MSRFARALLAPAFGAAIAFSYLAALLVLDRAITTRAVTATTLFAIAGFLAAWAALVAAQLFRRRPWSARMAASLICLLAGTVGFSALFTALQIVLIHHRLSEIPTGIAILILGISGLGATYNVLAFAAPLMLPLALPAVALFAILIARTPR